MEHVLQRTHVYASLDIRMMDNVEMLFVMEFQNLIVLFAQVMVVAFLQKNVHVHMVTVELIAVFQFVILFQPLVL
jgi:hypothetical protein